jgi:hypothetical protein
MTGVEDSKSPRRFLAGMFLWFWIIALLVLYLQTFESTIRLLAAAVAGWIG